MTHLTIAMPKGRIFEEAYQMLIEAGFNLPVRSGNVPQAYD